MEKKSGVVVYEDKVSNQIKTVKGTIQITPDFVIAIDDYGNEFFLKKDTVIRIKIKGDKNGN